MTMVILCRTEQLRFLHVTKIIRALMGFVDVFDLLGTYAALVGSLISTFGTTYLSELQGSSSPIGMLTTSWWVVMGGKVRAVFGY